MTATGRPLQPSVKVAGASLDQLMKNLEHPIDGIRYRTHIELSARNPDEVLAACKKWMAKFDPKKAEDAHHLLEALWLHQRLNVKNTELLNALLASPEPRAVTAAKTVQHHWNNCDWTRGGSVMTEKTKKIPKSGVSVSKKGVTEVRVATVVEKMQYDFKEFTVKPGAKVKITLYNADALPHNLMVLQPGAGAEVAAAAAAMGEAGFKKNFNPGSPKIIAATKLIDRDQEDSIEFTVPNTPGDYEFICTFPGHYPLMRGVMKVAK
jgi:azurin